MIVLRSNHLVTIVIQSEFIAVVTFAAAVLAVVVAWVIFTRTEADYGH